MTSKARAIATLQRVAKWRMVFAGWQLGTRAETDGECQAVRDHRELTMMLRIELNALTRSLIEAEVISEERWWKLLCDEAVEYDKMLRARFPGFNATDHGMRMDPVKAAETMRSHGFPP